MKLLLYLGNDFIGAARLNAQLIMLPGYIASFVRQLKKQNQLLIEQSALTPEFFISYGETHAADAALSHCACDGEAYQAKLMGTL